MANHCFNGTLDDANYSAPVPVIGLYIAAGSFVCMLLMLFDVISAFRHRQRWIPSRLFSLNSLTLTLLAICTKLPVDLTTAMPSALDQLSKLTATALMCVAIMFFSPSVGKNSGTEDLTNMVALSILVITVVVNMCIQIYTGVIHAFLVEHIIIMVCMLLLLLFLWHCAFAINAIKDYYLNFQRELATKVEGSLLQQLKLCYVLAFRANTQVMTASKPENFAMSGLCLISSSALIQAAVRSLILKQHFKLCEGTSDYDWSVWYIVTIQILVLVTGNFAIGIRWVAMFPLLRVRELIRNNYYEDSADSFIRAGPLLLRGYFWGRCSLVLRYYVSYLILWASIVINLPTTVFKIIEFLKHGATAIQKQEPLSVQEFKQPLPACILDHLYTGWSVTKAVSDLDQWMEISKSKPLNSLSRLLLTRSPSQHWHSRAWDALRLTGLLYPDDEGILLSSLSLSLLVKIATFSMPQNLTQVLQESFLEVFELVDVVDTTMNLGRVDCTTKSKVAKAMSLGQGFPVGPFSLQPSQCQLHNTLDILSKLKDNYNHAGNDVLSNDVRRIIDLINRQSYETIEELYVYIEQLYVDMLHLFLVHLPEALLKEVREGPVEEFEGRAKRALKMLYKIQSFETQVEWLFPEKSNISSMMSNPNEMLEEGQNEHSTNGAGDINDEIATISAQVDVIIPVEF